MEVAVKSRPATRGPGTSENLSHAITHTAAVSAPREYYRLRRLHPFQYLALPAVMDDSRKTDDHA